MMLADGPQGRCHVRVGADDQCPIELVGERIRHELHSDGNVRLFFLMPHPCRAALVTGLGLVLEMADNAPDADVPEGSNVFLMTGQGIWLPCRIGRKEIDTHQGFVRTADAVSQLVQIDPFKVRFLKLIYGVIEIEPVDVGNDSAHTGPR